MSASETRVIVTVIGGQGRVQILDHAFRVLAEGVGCAKVRLAPGLYKARATGGGGVQEKIFEIADGQEELKVPLKPMPISTPLPLPNALRDDAVNARLLAGPLDRAYFREDLGKGARFLLFVRGPESGEAVRFPVFELRNVQRHCALDINSLEVAEHHAHRTLTLLVELEPGPWQLCHVPAYGTPTSLAVQAVRGWRSELFLDFDENGNDQPGVPDLTGASMMMSRVNMPILLHDRELGIAELARHALARGSNTLSRAEIANLLHGKFGNRLLGLLAAHLELLAERKDFNLLRTVCANLAHLLGNDHPDVRALAIGVGKLGGKPRRKPKLTKLSPPLLRASWDILQAEGEALGKSVLSAIAGRTVNAGPWFAWEAQPMRSREVKAYAERSQPRAAEPVIELTDEMLVKSTSERSALSARRPADNGFTAHALVSEMLDCIDWSMLPEQVDTSSTPLSNLQRSLLPTLQLVAQQRSHGREFTERDLDRVRNALGVSWKTLATDLRGLSKRLPIMTPTLAAPR